MPEERVLMALIFLNLPKLISPYNAIHNVVYSLNANESHIPYRESKLTHMLKDSLGGMSRILMITCLVMVLNFTV